MTPHLNPRLPSTKAHRSLDLPTCPQLRRQGFLPMSGLCWVLRSWLLGLAALCIPWLPLGGRKSWKGCIQLSSLYNNYYFIDIHTYILLLYIFSEHHSESLCSTHIVFSPNTFHSIFLPRNPKCPLSISSNCIS